MTRDEFGALISGRLIVSCQADHQSHLRDTRTLARMAEAAVAGGAAAIRCGGVGGADDIAAIAAAVEAPILGLTKDGTDGVYITPTVVAALAVVDAGADVVAVDATNRPRPDGRSFKDTVHAVHAVGSLVMADIGTTAEGLAAEATGADAVATTLSGYTPTAPPRDGPDLELIRTLRAALPETLIIAEGRYHTPQLAAAAITAGATSVVVGTAITDPRWITASFVNEISRASRVIHDRGTTRRHSSRHRFDTLGG